MRPLSCPSAKRTMRVVSVRRAPPTMRWMAKIPASPDAVRLRATVCSKANQALCGRTARGCAAMAVAGTVVFS